MLIAIIFTGGLCVSYELRGGDSEELPPPVQWDTVVHGEQVQEPRQGE
jgi:hypothetical protein